MNPYRVRALELMAQIDIDGDGPIRAKRMEELADVLVELVRTTKDRESLELWSSVTNHLIAALSVDIERVNGGRV